MKEAVTTSPSDASWIEASLRASPGPMTVDEICALVFDRVGTRERNLVHVNLHRLGERGLVVKHAAKYSYKRKP